MISIARAVAIAFFALYLHPAFAQADSECTYKGGKEHCPQPIKLNPTFNWCNTGPDNGLTRRAFCEAGGGVWDGSVGDLGVCIGAGDPPADPNAARGLFRAFLLELHPSICGDPGGTGIAEVYTTLNCGASTGDTYVNGILTMRRRLEGYAGVDRDATMNECVHHWETALEIVEYFPLRCGAANSERSGAGGTVECTLPPPCGPCVGNPIDVGNGQKTERQVDYASPAPGGLSFVRHYNSGGFFDLVSREPVNGDHWRHSYSSTLLALPGNVYEMAAVIRPTGRVLHFNTSGVEIQNVDGAAHRLQRLTDGGGALTGWRLTTPEGDVELYDAQGRLTSITTRSGFVTTLAYDANGRLATVTDAYGRSLSLAYDALGQLILVTDPSARGYEYAYDSTGRLVSVRYPDNRTRAYLYENAEWPWLLTGITDERGVRYSSYGYDAFGRAVTTEHAGPDEKWTITDRSGWGGNIVTAVDAFNQPHTFTYSKIGGVLKLTRHQGPDRDDQYEYDANGNRTKHTNRAGTVNTYAYDATRNLETSRTEAQGTALARTIATTWHPTFRLPATITEPSGVAGVNLVTEFTYDASGNLTKKRQTAGTSVREWNYTVNARGQVLSIDGPRADVSDVTAIAYHADNDPCTGCRGQVMTVTNAAGHVTTFGSYDADGRPLQVTDANGEATTLAYTPRGWLSSRTVAGETTTYEYDAAGNLAKAILPDGSWVSYTYDTANGLVGIADSAGNSIAYVLDVRGNRVKEDVKDPQGALRRTGQWLYDQANRLHKVLGAAGQTTTYGYAIYDNFRTITDPLLRLTTDYKDAFGRVTSSVNPANGTTTFTYDAKDRLTSVKDPRNLTTTYTYNGLGDLTQQVSPDTGTTGFTYDAAGNVASQTDARAVTTTYTYDALNRVLSAAVADGTVSYEYDNTATGGPYARGRLTRITDPSGSTTWAYDALGRVTAKTQTVSATPADKSFTIGYAYSQGRQTGLTYPSGRVVTYGFNASGQVSAIAIDGATLLSGAEYFPFGPVRRWLWSNGQAYERTYDLDGRVKSVTLGPPTVAYADLEQAFGYDALDRLTTASLTAGQSLGYGYDANGNRTSTTVNGGSTTTYTYPGSSHRLSALSGATSRSFTYDAAGNLTASAGITYVYDGRGRMKQAGSTTYLVNGLGQRVKKSSGSARFFAYDEAGRLLGEYDGSGAPIQETVWLGDLPVATIRPKQPAGHEVYYVWADNLGSPRVVSDVANQLRWTWEPNEPFGNAPPNEDPAGQGVFVYNLRFPGQYYDSETGLHYNYFRDYDPAIGRYVQSDPIGLGGGINTYGYVGGAPLALSDPEGLMGQGSNGSGGRPMPGKRGFGGAGATPGFCGSGWNEPFVPDGFGTIDFNPACKKHDECYAKCGASKTECDLQLMRDIRKECDKLPPSGQRGFCRTLAVDYGVAVDILGGSAFRDAQRGAGAGR